MSNLDYQKWRRNMIEKGLWGDQFTTPDKTIAHIESCQRFGLSLQDIANESGLGIGTISRVMDGTHSKIWCETEDKILDVNPARVLPGEVPVFRARRRIEALMALGYSARWIADEVGATDASMTGILQSRWAHVRRGIFGPLSDLYDRLENTPRVPGTSYEKRSVTSTLNLSAARGYAPPAAWDDIDDPSERPKGRVEAVAA